MEEVVVKLLVVMSLDWQTANKLHSAFFSNALTSQHHLSQFLLLLILLILPLLHLLFLLLLLLLPTYNTLLSLALFSLFPSAILPFSPPSPPISNYPLCSFPPPGLSMREGDLLAEPAFYRDTGSGRLQF